MQKEDLDLFGSPEDYRWVPLSALKAGEYLSCIDGRHEECIIAAPGGDVGELVLLLGAVEEVAGMQFGFSQVERCLAELMEWHSRFYMHTDEAAVVRLGEALRSDPRFKSILGLEDVERVANFVRHPRRQFRNALAEYLVEPEYVGCGHLNLMIREPARYGLRQQLVKDVILSFYRRMWHGSPSPNFAVLPGEHEETAILVIDVPGPARGSTFVPSVRSGVLGDSRAFVVHEPARRFLREESLDLLMNSGAIHPSLDREAVRAELRLRSEMALEETIASLAPHLPRLHVIFDPSSHEITLEEE